MPTGDVSKSYSMSRKLQKTVKKADVTHSFSLPSHASVVTRLRAWDSAGTWGEDDEEVCIREEKPVFLCESVSTITICLVAYA